MAAKVYVQGLREFRRELKRAGEEFPRELRQANRDAAGIVATAARIRAPRGPHEGGGRVAPLVTSIKAGGTQGRGYVAIGGVRSPHAQVLEFGGSIPRRGRDPSLVAKARAGRRSFESVGITSRTRVRKQAYLYPAIDAKRDEVVEFYGRAIDRIARRAFPS